MSQVTIYLDDDTRRRVRKAARAEGVSVSKWIASALRQKTQSAWPKSVLDIEGAWPDFPTLAELRRPRVKDARREEM
jgi:hypothetical protein